jgi:hypothetical protein
MNEEEILIDFSKLAVGKIKIKHDPKFHRFPDELLEPRDEEVPKKKKRQQENIFGKPKPNETMSERADRLANAYKKIDIRKGHKNNITGDYILKHIFTQPCKKCGETDWHKLGCDRIDNTKGHLIDNVVCACRLCNLERNTRLFEDFYC